jgi:hypothetical protein
MTDLPARDDGAESRKFHVRSRIHYGKSGKVRTWIRCAGCRAWGDYTVTGVQEANRLLEVMNAKHECPGVNHV